MTFTTTLRSPRLSFKACGLFGLLALVWGSPAVSAQRVNIKATVQEATRGTVEHSYYQKQQALPQPFTSHVQFTQQDIGNQADCPTADGNIYYTPTGTFFVVQCSRHHWATTITKTTVSSLQECTDVCGQQPACKSIDYEIASHGCILQSEGGKSEENCQNHHYAYQIDPPTQPAKDEDLIPCSLSCPTGNGNSWTSIFDYKTFRINCGKRHGTPTIYGGSDHRPSLKACMQACAASLDCESVDYHDVSGTCYYTDHRGEPTIITPGFSSAFLIGNTSACNGDPIDGPPLKPVPTMPDLSCSNQGLEYAIWPNMDSSGKPNLKKDATYSSFLPLRFWYSKPERAGSTKTVAFSRSSDIYGAKPSNPEYVAVIHRGYLFIPKTGEYTFSCPYADELVWVWVEDRAGDAGYGKPNSKIRVVFGNPDAASSTYKKTFQQGEYVPLWITYANAGGDGSFKFQVTGPDGKDIVPNDPTKESLFLVQHSCDENSAPRYERWAPKAPKLSETCT